MTFDNTGEYDIIEKNYSKYIKDISENSKVRFDAIVNRIPSDTKKILNVGVATNSVRREERGWLHGYLLEYTEADVTGVSLRDAERMTKRGFDVRDMDGQYLDFNETFDVIIAGQIMRNFYAFGEFFANVKDHLNKNGKLIFTLPNPHGFSEFRKAWTGDVNNKTYLSPENIEFMLRNSDSKLALREYQFLPGKAGGVSDILYKMGVKRIGSPTYIGTIEPE